MEVTAADDLLNALSRTRGIRRRAGTEEQQTMSPLRSDLENLPHSEVEPGRAFSESKVGAEVELVVTTQEKS